ncbi:MAG: hypothetical protein ACYDBJ_16255 [Aggregatilineales bacterium]
MSGLRAENIELSEAQQQILEQMVGQRHREQGVVDRAQSILGAAAGHSSAEIGRRLKQQRLSVLLWRKRWAAASESVAAVEAAQDEKQPLPAAIEQVLQDAKRTTGHVQRGASGSDRGDKLRRPGREWLAHQAVDAPRRRPRSTAARQCRPQFTPKCGTFFKRRPICNRIRSNIG